MNTTKSVDIITPQKPKNNSADENKSNTEQKQKEHRETDCEALTAEIIELKPFVIEVL